MVDFSRAERSKNHRSSFLKASENVIDFMEQLQVKYKTTWDETEVVRKQRAAIIEETIQLLKNNKIKLGKQLGRCNNSELNEELLNAINSLDDEEKEKIQINMIKINNRYDKIQKLGIELENMMKTLSNYRVLEDDYEDEVVITIPKKETKVTEDQPKIEKIEEETEEVVSVEPKEVEESTKDEGFEDFIDTEELEKVINIKEANDKLKNDLARTISSLNTTEKESSIKPTLIEDEDIRYISEEDLFDTNELASIQDEVDYITNNELEAEIYEAEEKDDNKDEFILFTIDDNLTLKDIAQNVYQNEDNWIYLYNYRNNTNKIDRKAAEFDASVEDIASTPRCLSGVTLEFPTELVASKIDNIEDVHKRKAA